MISIKGVLSTAAALFCSLGLFEAKADVFTDSAINGGEFTRAGFVDPTNTRGHGNWAAFTLGGSFITDISSADDLESMDIYGDVGVAGAGDIKMGAGATIHGDLYWESGGTLTMNSTSMVTGRKHHDTTAGGPYDTILNQGVSDAANISTMAFSRPVTDPTLTTVNGKNQNYNYSLTGTLTVLKLTDFAMSGGTFTLMGTAAQSIIINVTNNFSLTAAAKIVLSGGMDWDNVLFNVVGKGNVVSFDQASSMRGILLATQRTIRMKNGSRVSGEVIGNTIQIGSNSVINNPAVVSP